jgi:UDP-2,3-diacylglucosamine pyrophosphatase LpxH
VITLINRTTFRAEVSAGEKLLFISDVHFDATKCDREMLTRHLDEARKEKAKVFIFGDWFDLMQGKYDPRGNYSDLRPEYKSITYLDDVIEDSARYLAQYKKEIVFIGRGNHETNIEKRLHTSPLDRLAALHNHHGGKITIGGYSGWIIFNLMRSGKPASQSKVHFHHGYGGNAPRSKGVLGVDIDQMQFPDANMIVRGHTHQKWHVPVVVDRINERGNCYQQRTHHLRTGSYKKLGDRFAGWAVEKNFNTPSLGGWWVTPYRQTNPERVSWKVEEAS